MVKSTGESLSVVLTCARSLSHTPTILSRQHTLWACSHLTFTTFLHGNLHPSLELFSFCSTLPFYFFQSIKLQSHIPGTNLAYPLIWILLGFPYQSETRPNICDFKVLIISLSLFYSMNVSNSNCKYLSLPPSWISSFASFPPLFYTPQILGLGFSFFSF